MTGTRTECRNYCSHQTGPGNTLVLEHALLFCSHRSLSIFWEERRVYNLVKSGWDEHVSHFYGETSLESGNKTTHESLWNSFPTDFNDNLLIRTGSKPKKKTWWRSPHAFGDGSLDSHIGIFNKGVKLVGMQLFLQSLLHIRRKRDAASDDLSLLCDFPVVIWTLLKMVPFKFAEVRLRCALLLPESLNAGRSCHLST